MSLRQYEYALAVAEAGSVTAAAELLELLRQEVWSEPASFSPVS